MYNGSRNLETFKTLNDVNPAFMKKSFCQTRCTKEKEKQLRNTKPKHCQIRR